MPKKNTFLEKISALTWRDLEEWAGSRIVSRGRKYQQQGRVKDLAVMEDGTLVAWVDGSEKYATKVIMDDSGLPESTCSCPYAIDCKHGVALVVEYLQRIETKQPISKAIKDDKRIRCLEDAYWEEDLNNNEYALPESIQQDIDNYLKGKTKAQLIELVNEFASHYPEMATELSERRQLNSGNAKTIVARLRREIQDVGSEPGWQNYWQNEGFTPDYSGIRRKMRTLLKAGHIAELLSLGKELIAIGSRQVEESHDEGETAMEITTCMPLLVETLDRSSLDCTGKLNWALDAVLADQYGIYDSFAEYLHRRHPKSAWHKLADQLLARLDSHKSAKDTSKFSRRYERDQISHWTIHALEQAGRKKEIIPLCIAEAKRTESYNRLVKHLVAAQRYDDAENWIRKGIRATRKKWPGIAAGLRNELMNIRMIEKNWPAVTAMQVEDFVHRPSRTAFIDCKKASEKIKAWTQVRAYLLRFLEKGELPWKQKEWALPISGLYEPTQDRKKQFPLVNDLIDIAIYEKKPEQVLKWYDQLPGNRLGGYGIDEDAVAAAIKNHAPDRAVDVWKNMAGKLIDQVKPKAYQAAAKYLVKAAKVMNQLKKQAEWEQYLQALRKKHFRKRRLLEVLDGLDDKPILKT